MADDDALIVFEDVYKSFGSLHVLRGVSLRIRKGESLCIIGQSGVGKSVSLRLMIGLLSPDRGRVLFQGKEVAQMNEAELVELRSHFAMLFQSGALFDSMTIGDNIAFPAKLRGVKDREQLQKIVEDNLYAVGLGKARFPEMPDKMPSMVSGGQRKRIALARALAQEPEIILYDEPTTGLDPIMSAAISDLMVSTRAARRHTNLTSIIVTHDMNVAFQTADRIVMMNGGEIVGEGAPDYFMGIQNAPDTAGMNDSQRMIRQFVRGEAEGLIQAVK